MDESILKCETRQVKAVFPGTLNNHDTLFGGIAMQWMDEVAFITATRYTRKKMVTVSVDKVFFLSPVPAGTIAEIIGQIVKVNHVKIEILVEIFVEEMYVRNRYKAVQASFVLAAVNQNRKPVRLSQKELKDSN